MTGLNGFMQRNLLSSLTPSECQVLEGSGREKNTKCEGKSFSFWYPPRLHLHALYLPLLTPHNFFPELSQTSITLYTPSYKPSSIFTASHRPSATSTDLLCPFIHLLHLHILHFPCSLSYRVWSFNLPWNPQFPFQSRYRAKSKIQTEF